MTEQEAKTKWCPAARVFNFMGTAAGNRELQGDNTVLGALCIGSNCMAWRWEGYRYTKDYGTDKAGKMVPAEVIERDGVAGYQGKFPLDHVGYCGLAGQSS